MEANMTEVIKTVSAQNVPAGFKVIATTSNGQKIVVRNDKSHIAA
jgi:hypothetical protein